MNTGQAAAGMGLLSACSWGGSDFAGGVGARRAPALLVVFSGQIVTLLLLLIICWVLHIPAQPRSDAMLALAGGFEGALSLALFYRALAMGEMGLTAALTGLLTALVPVVFAISRDGLPGMAACAGLAVGLVAIWLITYSSRTDRETAFRTAGARLALVLGAVSGVGFGVQMILFNMASAGGVLWTMTLGRVAGVTALTLVVIAMRPAVSGRSFLWIGILASLLDTIGNGFFVWAASFGRLEAAALISSLYPGVTILLAAVVLREWPTKRQMAGLALALVAVGLLGF